jgi:prolipoprotein diacylglyceryltransferase
MIAGLELSFDPLVSVGGVVIRWDALALVGVLLVAIGVWVVRLHESLGSALRFDEVSFVLLGAIPGAVVGGRLVHVLDYWDGYQLRPLTMLDLGHGSLSLVGAVVGGSLSAAYICRLMGGRVGIWADAAAVPLLLAIGLGKLGLLLGGGGQGSATDGPAGLSFTGPGPWRSLDAATPGWPSQALEGGWALLGIPVVLIGEAALRRRGRSGRGIALLTALTWWLAGRVVVGLTWRDEPFVGPMGAETVATLVVLLGVLIGLVAAWRAPIAPASGHQTVPEGPGLTGTGGP